MIDLLQIATIGFDIAEDTNSTSKENGKHVHKHAIWPTIFQKKKAKFILRDVLFSNLPNPNLVNGIR